MIRRTCHALGATLALMTLLAGCDRGATDGDQVQQHDWSPHAKMLLAFIERYKTDDPEQARAAMLEELEYLKEPLDKEISKEELAYLRALARIRLAMITHHLGHEKDAQTLFHVGTLEYNQWSEAKHKETCDEAAVIEAVLDCDQGFSAPWHEPWKSQPDATVAQ